MITHYDMLTGEVIEDRRPDAHDHCGMQPRHALQPRLLSVDEAMNHEPPVAAATPAIVMLPIAYLIAD